VGWADVASSPVTTTSTTAARVRSAAITLTDGRWYRVAIKSSSTKETVTIYRAGIVVQQVGSVAGTVDSYSESNVDSDYALASDNFTGIGQSFTGDGNIIDYCQFYLKKFRGSPTGNAVAKIFSHSGTFGTSSVPNALLATSDNFDVSTLTSSYALTSLSFTGANRIQLVSGTKYVVCFEYSGGAFVVNDVALGYDNSSPSHTGNSCKKTSGAYSTTAGVDATFYVFSLEGTITKLEPQYLLANTLFAAGTALQTFLTKWDSTEWSGVTNTYTGQAEAANGSTSVILITDAAGSTTVATISSPDNAGTGAATMPADGNLDTKATTNAGDVAAARILVATVVSTNSTLTPSVSDSTAVTDTPTILIPTIYISVSDSTTVSDTPTTKLLSYINVTDSTTVSDTVAVALISVFSVADSTAIGETVTMQIVSYINVTDSTAVSDTINLYITTLFLSVSDSSTVSDTPTVNLRSFINVTDSTAIGETVTMRLFSNINVNDSTAVTDTASLYITTLFISVSDSSAVSDSASITAGASGFSVNDTTTVTDIATVLIPILTLSVSESTTVSDTPTLVVASVGTLLLSVTDSTAVTDSAVLTLSVVSKGFSFVVFID
jgi:hypothetical protein